MSSPKGPLLRIFELLRTAKHKVFFLVFLIVLAMALDIAVQFIVQGLIDRLVDFFKKGGQTPTDILLLSSLGILVATLVARGLKSFYDYHLFKNVTALEDRTKSMVIEKYYKLHAMFHHGSSSGQIIGRIERGASALYTILYGIFGQNLLPPLIVFGGVMFALLYKDPWIALIVFLPLPIYIFSSRRIAEKIYHIEKKVNDQFEEVAKESYDVAANILTVKKFSQEEVEVKHLKELLGQARITQYSAERLWETLTLIQTVIATAGKIAVIVAAGMFALKGRSTIGEFVLYVSLHGMAYAPMAQLSNILPSLRRNSARAERLFGIMDEPILVTDKPDARVLPPHQKAIEFKGVSFRYGTGRRWALQDVDVTVPAGSTVALVGKSGSGKTTFVNLLLRSFDPEKGQVLIDGQDLRDVKRESLLGQIAVVPQEVDLFSRTIRENIAYGKPEVTEEQIIDAAKTALAHEFIMNMEQCYDTLVGERGIKLSGGERQRIGIARAVLRDPRILILDEATSHLDTESERLIAQATNALIEDRTTFIIAHRLSTILGADKILVFSNGVIEAQGMHEELLTISPTYQRLYSLQFNELEEGEEEE